MAVTSDIGLLIDARGLGLPNQILKLLPLWSHQ
jgi:hypothetical protein